jgi:diguanylate cyclase (GGDEF)-like protein/PAS domain S-box-containing protein
MNRNNETLLLLILDHSQNDAEKLVSLLRNAGIPTRAERIETEEDLSNQLQSQSWDLFIAKKSDADFDLDQVSRLAREHDRDLSFIILSESYDPDETVQHLKAGAKDVVPVDQEMHLLAVVKRELLNLQERKSLRYLQVQIHDVEHRCELLLDSSKDAIAYINDGMHIYANSSYMNFLGYDDIDELICIPVLDTFSSDAQAKFKELSKQFYDNETFDDIEDIESTTLREDGTEIPVSMSLSEASYDGERCLQIILRPQQDSAELEEKLKELSQVDLLTGLYNRNYFMDCLRNAKESALESKTNYALFYLTIDQFQSIKVKFGIADADVILRDVAHFMKQEIEAKEGFTLARLSDDVFGVLGPCSGIEAALEQGQALCKCIEDHLFEVEGKSIQITFSIGATLITDNAPDIKNILGRAQIASDEVKSLPDHENGNGVHLYKPSQGTKLDDHDVAITLIDQALEEDSFKLLFQPIISLRGEGQEHYEAFIRMIDNNGKEVSPYDFLPPTGPSQVANKIDKWVILQTIKHLSEHRSKGHDTRLFINLCSETLQDQSFTSWLNVALQAARLPGDSLIFQVSESNAITYMKQAKEFEKGLRTLHCNLSVNQFGRALNPFNLFKHLSPDYIKLEGSYTGQMQKGEEEKEQVKDMIKTLQSMDKKTIVPLVESASLLSTLWQAGVNYIQGYYLQAPSSEMNYDFSEDS